APRTDRGREGAGPRRRRPRRRARPREQGLGRAPRWALRSAGLGRGREAGRGRGRHALAPLLRRGDESRDLRRTGKRERSVSVREIHSRNRAVRLAALAGVVAALVAVTAGCGGSSKSGGSSG